MDKKKSSYKPVQSGKLPMLYYQYTGFFLEIKYRVSVKLLAALKRRETNFVFRVYV